MIIPPDVLAVAKAVFLKAVHDPAITEMSQYMALTVVAERERCVGAIDTLRESLMEGLMTDAGLTEADRAAMNHQLAALELAAEAIRNPTGA